MNTPMRLVLIGSKPARLPGEVVNQCARVSAVADRTDADAEQDGDAERPHRPIGTVRSFVHVGFQQSGMP